MNTQTKHVGYGLRALKVTGVTLRRLRATFAVSRSLVEHHIDKDGKSGTFYGLRRGLSARVFGRLFAIYVETDLD